MHLIKGRRRLRDIFVARSELGPGAARGVTSPRIATRVVATKRDIEDLEGQRRNSILHNNTYNLHLRPHAANITLLRRKAHNRRPPLAGLGSVGPDIAWNSAAGEEPDFDTRGFDLRCPDAAAFLNEGLAEGAGVGSSATASGGVAAVRAEDVAGALLSVHGAIGGGGG